MPSLMPTGKQQYFYTGSSKPLVGGQVYTYAAGTGTPKTTYQDAAGSIPNTNPVTLDSTGSALIFWDGAYKVVLVDALGNTIYTVDNYNSDPFGVGSFISNIASSIGASLIGFILTAIGAVRRTILDKLSDTVSVKDFGVKGDGTDETIGITKAWNHCLTNGKNLHFPAGVYSCGANNFPFKNPTFPATTAIDCGNITISGDGPATVLKTVSAAGADVINPYFVKNLHFKDFYITATLTGSAGSGSNGVSVVGGFDNLTFDGIVCYDLPYVDKGTYLDGGKALTIQPGTPTEDCGTLKATRFFAIGCVYGAGLEVDLVNWGTKKHAIDIDLVAENCYQGVVFSAGAATAALSTGMTMGYRVRAQLVNCQRGVIIARAHGMQIEAHIITTKTAAARRLNPSGGAWASAVTTVDGLLCTYAKNSRVSVTGDLGGCDYKVQIGGASPGSSGLSDTTDNCQFYIDLGGTAATADVNSVFGTAGYSTNCTFYFSTTTTSVALPTTLYTASYNNTVIKGPGQRLLSPTIAGTLSFASTDGITSYNTVQQVANELTAQQTGSSSVSAKLFRFLNHAGVMEFAIRNDGALVTQGRFTAASVTTVKQVMPIYDNTDTLVGYVPIYTTYA
jgi:hypothetical protein